MSEVLLEFRDVVLPGRGTRVSVTVPPHRAVSIVGAEASGVDAMPDYALALRRPTGGQVVVYGVDVATLSPRAALAFRRRVGYLPAGDALLQNLSLRDNVALPLRYGSNMTDREIQGRLQVILALLRITDVADARPAEANEEQRRRAAMGRALAFDPQLLLLADPFDGLTTRAAAELYEIARGGETGEGARRTVFMTGQFVPERVEQRIETRFRLAGGTLERVH
jgi:ABC-type transporter Mla maintaining outer membrane lipid asymmetry ATPase subunit MlaF